MVQTPHTHTHTNRRRYAADRVVLSAEDNGAGGHLLLRGAGWDVLPATQGRGQRVRGHWRHRVRDWNCALRELHAHTHTKRNSRFKLPLTQKHKNIQRLTMNTVDVFQANN